MNRYIFGMVNRESVVMVNRYSFVVVKDTPKRPPKTKRHHQKRPPKIRLPENTKWSFLMFVDVFGCFLMVFDGFYSMEEGPMERFRVSPDHHLTTKIDPKWIKKHQRTSRNINKHQQTSRKTNKKDHQRPDDHHHKRPPKTK